MPQHKVLHAVAMRGRSARISHKHTHRPDPASRDCPRRHNHKEARPTRACSARRTRPGTRRLRYRRGPASNTNRQASAACNLVAASSSVKARQRSTPNKQGVDVSDWSRALFFTGPGGASSSLPFCLDCFVNQDGGAGGGLATLSLRNDAASTLRAVATTRLNIASLAFVCQRRRI